MAIDSLEVRAAPSGHVYIAPILTAAPVDVTTPLAAPYSELGYIDQEGVTITPGIEIQDIMMWQSATVVKQLLQSASFEVSFTMGQINRTTTSVFFLGSTWTDDGTTASMTVPSSPQISDNEFAMVVEWEDGEGFTTRFYAGRGTIGEREAMQLSRADVVKLGVTYKVLDNSGELVNILSNNPSLVDAS